ncbi:MAG: hypothetical protein IJ143_09780 [Neisseriaceae bacterium]|nr:hypothetical protein [Neisseriaceae bacterium]
MNDTTEINKQNPVISFIVEKYRQIIVGVISTIAIIGAVVLMQNPTGFEKVCLVIAAFIAIYYSFFEDDEVVIFNPAPVLFFAAFFYTLAIV